MSEQNSMFQPQEQDATPLSQEPTYVPRQPRITQKLKFEQQEQNAHESNLPPPPLLDSSIPPLGAFGTYDNGYTGAGAQSSSNYEKLNAKSASSNEKWIYLFIGIVIGVVFASLFVNSVGGLAPLTIIVIAGILFWAYTGNRSVIEEPPRVFAVEDMATLVVQNSVGSLYVHRGDAKRIVVKATKQANGRFSHPEDMLLSSIQQGNQITINALSQPGRSGIVVPASVALDIEVPEHCDLQVVQKIGSIHLDSVEGQFQLKQNIGSIKAKNVSLHKQTSLDMAIGSIEFDGTLDPAGTYHYKVNIGSIEMHLPVTSAFEVHTSTNLGSATNQFGTASVGMEPRARLDLDVNIGSSDIRQR